MTVSHILIDLISSVDDVAQICFHFDLNSVFCYTSFIHCLLRTLARNKSLLDKINYQHYSALHAAIRTFDTYNTQFVIGWINLVMLR